MKDLYIKPVQGHIVVECLNQNKEVIDRFENHNLIMDSARIAIPKLACGLSTSSEMNKIVLGTEGHVSGDLLTPKGEAQGFISSRTQLFSEESQTYAYPIVFTNPGTASGSCSIVSEPNSGSTINLEYITNSIQYTIEIPNDAANGTGVTSFTEAALYAGTNIFSMKCFPAKIKDNTVSLRIVWKIIF